MKKLTTSSVITQKSKVCCLKSIVYSLLLLFLTVAVLLPGCARKPKEIRIGAI